MPSFYDDQNIINTNYALNVGLINYFSNLLLKSDTTRMTYSSTAYAFRKRSDSNAGVLNMPFVNYYLENFTFNNDRNWYNNRLSKGDGIFIPELPAKLLLMPCTFEYEASFWCNRNDELLYALQQINLQKEYHIEVPFDIQIDGITVMMIAVLSLGSPTKDPQYTETDWLERNNIHSVGMNFVVHTFIPKTDLTITVPDTVVFSLYNYGEVVTDTVELTIDHDNETVTEV